MANKIISIRLPDDLLDKIIFSNKSFEICNIDKPLNNSNIEDENIKYRKIYGCKY